MSIMNGIFWALYANREKLDKGFQTENANYVRAFLPPPSLARIRGFWVGAARSLHTG